MDIWQVEFFTFYTFWVTQKKNEMFKNNEAYKRKIFKKIWENIKVTFWNVANKIEASVNVLN